MTPTILATIALDDLRPSPTNPRKTFERLDELADSIRTHGILQDILVRPIGTDATPARYDAKAKAWECDHFEIVAGERRFRAARLAGLTELSAKVRVMPDAEVLALQLIENDQREDVRPSEQAAAYKRLVDAVGLAEAARQIGKPEATVRGTALLARAPAPLAAAVDAGLVGRSVAELVCRVPGERSRAKAAYCVMIGEMTPPSDDEWDAIDDVRPNIERGNGVLTHRETKELISRHFTRELKTAPFSRKTLYVLPDPDGEKGQTRIGHDCDGCPKRAGNDPTAKAENVRGDICLDPECYGEKAEAHRRQEIEKFAKKIHGDPKANVCVIDTVVGALAPGGYCLLSELVTASELGMNDRFKPKQQGQTVGELLDGVAPVGPSVPKILAFDAKGKPCPLVRTADLRKRLIAAGLMPKPEKPKPAPCPAVTANGKPATTSSADGPYLLYRVRLNPDVMPAVEFDAVDGTTPDELREQAASAFMDWFDGIGWADAKRIPQPFVDYERVPESEAAPAPAQTPAPDAKPFTYDDAIRKILHGQVGSAERWAKLIEEGATDAEIKAVLADVWGGGGGGCGPASESRPRYDYRYKGGSSPSLECTVGDDDQPLKLKGVPLIDRVRSVLNIPHPDDVQTPAPGPVVCSPGEAKLADIPGITKDDAACLHAVGITTLAGLDQKLDALRAERGRQNATVYDVLRQYGGAFTPGDAVRIGDAIMDHLNVGAAVSAAVDAVESKAAKGKRKGVRG